MFKKMLLVVVCVWFQPTHAHEFLTEILVYPEDTIKISPHSTYNVIETFHFSHRDLNKSFKKDLVKQEIKRIVAKRHDDINPDHVVCDDWDGVFKTCGVFDHWNEARSIAIDTCAGVAVSYAGLFPDGLIPQFIGPNTFIDGGSAAADHHSIYDFSQGLSFNCVEVISNLVTE